VPQVSSCSKHKRAHHALTCAYKCTVCEVRLWGYTVWSKDSLTLSVCTGLNHMKLLTLAQWCWLPSIHLSVHPTGYAVASCIELLCTSVSAAPSGHMCGFGFGSLICSLNVHLIVTDSMSLLPRTNNKASPCPLISTTSEASFSLWRAHRSSQRELWVCAIASI
jgi:hypothetical protein